MRTEDLASNDNPATKLFRTLSDWSVLPAGQSVYGVRGGESDFWRTTMEAARWCDLTLAEVFSQSEHDDQVLDVMASVIDDCRGAILALGIAMNDSTANTRVLIGSDSLRALWLFARSWQPVSLEPQARGDVLDLVRRMRDLVSSSVDLGPEVKDYVTRLALNIEATLSSSRIWGIVDLRDQSMQLAAAIQAFVIDSEEVDEQVKQDTKPLLVRLQKRLVTTWWVDVVPKMISTGFGVAQHELESGINGGS